MLQAQPCLTALNSLLGERPLAFESKHSLLSTCLNKAREAGRRPVAREEEVRAVWDSTQTLGC